jgi:hypothetical protein
MPANSPQSLRTIEIPQIVAIDFDRMLASDEVSMERLYAVAIDFSINTRHIDAAREQTEQDGGSFEPLTIVKTELDDDARFEAFLEHYKSLDGYPLLFPDAAPFLSRLDEAGVAHKVLTYGVSALWQETKILASGYTGDFEVMEHSDKGHRIAAWKRDGKYVFERPDQGIVYLADTICLLDDKAKAFASLPTDCTGFWIKRSEVLLPSQRGEVPRDLVQDIYSLGELAVQNQRVVRLQVDA